MKKKKPGRESHAPGRGRQSARATPASRRRGRPLGRPTDHDRDRWQSQTHDTDVERVPRLGSRGLREGEGWGGKGGRACFAADFFTAAVWCVPFSGAVGFSKKLQKQKKSVFCDMAPM